MANILSVSVRGFKLSNSTVQRNVSFIYRGFAHVPKGDVPQGGAKEIYTKGEDANLAKNTTIIFKRKPKPASGGSVQMFSTAATASVKGPVKPGKDKGSPPKHDNQPVKAPEKPAKDTGSGSKNLHEESKK